MISKCPRLTIAALRGGSGKTLISMGLSSFLKEEGYDIAVFKKGPDFIDPSWLSLASGNKCFNLDPFLMSTNELISSFVFNTYLKDFAIVEGNRGLFDGMDLKGKYSTAELAKLLDTPVFLILDVSMTTRTAAAILRGCQVFDPELNIRGVILNKVAGYRQEKLIKACIDNYCGIPVVGVIPKLRKNLLKERHMGLVPYQEREQAEEIIYWARDIVKKYVDIKLIKDITVKVSSLTVDYFKSSSPCSIPVKIGFFLDKAFWFYYPENLDFLKSMGADLIRIDAINNDYIPDVDAIYIGGGFPETQAQFLANNDKIKGDLRNKIEQGLPVYAECGGFMYLGQSLIMEDKEYPMVGVLPVKFFLEKKPQGHGYTIIEVCESNPFFKVGNIIRGHEFHYSKPFITDTKDIKFVFRVIRGNGICDKKDGLCRKNVLATYTHIHAKGHNTWAEALVSAAYLFKTKNRNYRMKLKF